MKKTRCHIKSEKVIGSTSASTKKIIDSPLGFKFLRLNMIIEKIHIAANMALNDRWVAETIMSDLWQDQFNHAVLAFGILGSWFSFMVLNNFKIMINKL